MEDVSNLEPVRAKVDPFATVTAGNASQLSDGASACVLMEEGLALSMGLKPLGNKSGYFYIVFDELFVCRSVQRICRCGLSSRRDGHRTGVCGTKATSATRADYPRYRLVVDERFCVLPLCLILYREMNEAFAVVPLHCSDVLGIDHDKMNVNGGAISIGHPFGMTGSRQVCLYVYVKKVKSLFSQNLLFVA